MGYKFRHGGAESYNRHETDTNNMLDKSQSGRKFTGKVDDPEMDNCADKKFIESTLADKITSRDVLAT